MHKITRVLLVMLCVAFQSTLMTPARAQSTFTNNVGSVTGTVLGNTIATGEQQAFTGVANSMINNNRATPSSSQPPNILSAYMLTSQYSRPTPSTNSDHSYQPNYTAPPALPVAVLTEHTDPNAARCQLFSHTVQDGNSSHVVQTMACLRSDGRWHDVQ